MDFRQLRLPSHVLDLTKTQRRIFPQFRSPYYINPIWEKKILLEIRRNGAEGCRR